jgi:hypothetical protein
MITTGRWRKREINRRQRKNEERDQEEREGRRQRE